MTNAKELYVTFMLSELEKGADAKDVMAQCFTKWHFTQRTFFRYWKIARDKHIATQLDAQKVLAAQSIQSAVERQEGAIIDKNRRMEIASEIATDPKASKNDRIKALDYLSRIDGDYAPVKKDFVIDANVDFVVNVTE